MVAKARVRLSSIDAKVLDNICEQIRNIADRAGVKMSGPVPLPTKRLKVPVRKSPCGNGRESYETWHARIHKRLIDIGADERALRLIMRLQIPTDVNMEMEILD